MKKSLRWKRGNVNHVTIDCVWCNYWKIDSIFEISSDGRRFVYRTIFSIFILDPNIQGVLIHFQTLHSSHCSILPRHDPQKPTFRFEINDIYWSSMIISTYSRKDFSKIHALFWKSIKLVLRRVNGLFEKIKISFKLERLRNEGLLLNFNANHLHITKLETWIITRPLSREGPIICEWQKNRYETSTLVQLALIYWLFSIFKDDFCHF